jgi:hypothetical protein
MLDQILTKIGDEYGRIDDLFTNAPEWLRWILGHSNWIWLIIAAPLVFILTRIAGPRTKTIYEQPKKEGYADFRDYGSKTYTTSGPTGAIGEGGHRIFKKGIIEISRTNAEGRWILQFLTFRSEDDQILPYIPARREAGSRRSFNVTLEPTAILTPTKSSFQMPICRLNKISGRSSSG